MESTKKERVINIPNLLSLSRIFCIPFLVYLIQTQKNTAALILFMVAASTDLLDGLAARVLKQQTKLGALLDPAGDKLLMTAGFLMLSFAPESLANSIPLWVTLTVILRDIYIVTGAVILFRLIGKKSYPPTQLGKYSTVLQMGLLFLVLLLNAWQKDPVWLTWIYILTVIITVLSGLQYTLIGKRWFSAFKKENTGI